MANLSLTPRDVARELARRYSTMTHDELDILEGILIPRKYAKNELILREGGLREHLLGGEGSRQAVLLQEQERTH